MSMNLYDNKNSWSEIQVLDRRFQYRRWTTETRYEHFLGVNTEGQYLYMLRLEDSKNPEVSLPTISGCSSFIVDLDGSQYFCLALKKQEDWVIFKLLTQVLIRELEKEYHRKATLVFSQLKTILKHCGNFFRKETGAFGRNQAIGLFGELVFLEQYVIPEMGWENALSCWKGPSGAPQDFSVRDTTVEIKSTEAAGKQSIHISNAEQLATGFTHGFLGVVGLSSGVDSRAGVSSLLCLVQRLKEGFEQETGSSEMLLALLNMVGYDESSPEASKPYGVLGITFYEMLEGFPRILPDMLPLGISNIQYTIDLNMCNSFIRKPYWIEK